MPEILRNLRETILKEGYSLTEFSIEDLLYIVRNKL